MTISPAKALPDPAFFIAGGSLHKDAACYITRHADAALFDALRRGQFCYTLTSRQMGKSSLMVRTAVRLRESGVAVAVLDLTAFGTNLTPEQWYDLMLNRVGRHLGLEDELDDFWNANARVAPLARFLAGLREVALPAVQGRETRKRDTRADEDSGQVPSLVLMIDEVDLVRSLPFSADEFFAAIRELYNRRTQDAAMNEIAVALFGVAAPSDLISDPRITPFNIGTRIELKDFSRNEAAPLTAGLGSGELLDRVLYWTGGHPYLTLYLCQAAAKERAAVPADIDRLCQELYLSSRARENDTNLLFVRDRLLRSGVDIAALLEMYRKIWLGKPVPDDETSPLVSVLRLSGIVRAEKGVLKVRNRIYAQVFDKAWILANMPQAELRRQRAAFRKGVLRAVSLSGALLAIMGSLTFIAVRESRRANAMTAELKRLNSLLADRNAERANMAKTGNRADILAGKLLSDPKTPRPLQSEKHLASVDRAKTKLYAAYPATVELAPPLRIFNPHLLESQRKQQDKWQELVDLRQKMAAGYRKIYRQSQEIRASSYPFTVDPKASDEDKRRAASDEEQFLSDERQYYSSLIGYGKTLVLAHRLEDACAPLNEALNYYRANDDTVATELEILLANAHYRLKQTQIAQNDYTALMRRANPTDREHFYEATNRFQLPEKFYEPMAKTLGVSLIAPPPAKSNIASRAIGEATGKNVKGGDRMQADVSPASCAVEITLKDRMKNLSLGLNLRPRVRVTQGSKRVAKYRWQILDANGNLLVTMLPNSESGFVLSDDMLAKVANAGAKATLKAEVFDAQDQVIAEDSTPITISQKKGTAFIVGIDDYPNAPIEYMAADATAFRDKLVQLGYDKSNIWLITATGGQVFVNDKPVDPKLLDNGLLTDAFLNDQFNRFLDRAYRIGATHFTLYFCGHGETQGDQDALMLPNGKDIGAHEWAQKILTGVDKKELPKYTVIGLYQACRTDKTKKNNSNNNGFGQETERAARYFPLQSCDANSQSYVDGGPGSDVDFGIKSGFFGKALIDTMDDLMKSPRLIPVYTAADLYSGIRIHLRDITDKFKKTQNLPGLPTNANSLNSFFADDIKP